VQQSLNLEANSKRIAFIGLNPQRAKTRYALEKESGMYQTQKVSKLIKPGEGTKLTQGASPQKKLEDKRE
jgi:hypothetical protein